MKYRDISDDVNDQFDLPPSHPILATLSIDPADWFRFQQFDDDNPATCILGYDEPCDERMTVHVACASRTVRDRLEDGWG
jgi:hypothetical protein